MVVLSRSFNLYFYYFLSSHTSISHKWPMNVWTSINFQSVNGEVRMRTVCMCICVYSFETIERDMNSMQMSRLCQCAITLCQSVVCIQLLCAKERQNDSTPFNTETHTHSLARTHTHTQARKSIPLAPVSIFFCVGLCVYRNRCTAILMRHHRLVLECVCACGGIQYLTCVRSTLLVK